MDSLRFGVNSICLQIRIRSLASGLRNDCHATRRVAKGGGRAAPGHGEDVGQDDAGGLKGQVRGATEARGGKDGVTPRCLSSAKKK